MELVIKTNPRFGKVKLEKDDCINNVVTEDSAVKVQKDGTLWRGPKEKAVSFMELLISGLCPNNGIVIDLNAGTGTKCHLGIF